MIIGKTPPASSVIDVHLTPIVTVRHWVRVAIQRLLGLPLLSSGVTIARASARIRLTAPGGGPFLSGGLGFLRQACRTGGPSPPLGTRPASWPGGRGLLAAGHSLGTSRGADRVGCDRGEHAGQLAGRLALATPGNALQADTRT